MHELLRLVVNIGAAARVGDLRCHAQPLDRLHDVCLRAPEIGIVDPHVAVERPREEIGEARQRLRMCRPSGPGPQHVSDRWQVEADDAGLVEGDPVSFEDLSGDRPEGCKQKGAGAMRALPRRSALHLDAHGHMAAGIRAEPARQRGAQVALYRCDLAR